MLNLSLVEILVLKKELFDGSLETLLTRIVEPRSLFTGDESVFKGHLEKVRVAVHGGAPRGMRGLLQST